MKKKLIISSAITIALLIIVYFVFINGKSAAVTYTTGSVTKGDIQVVITSTGTLEALSTVDVGTQVSGIVTKLFVDYNSEVKQGQLLAVIDTTTLAAQVRDAKASLDKAKAEYNLKSALHERNKKLFDTKYLAETDLLTSETDLESAKASLKSAELSLEKAKTNLHYAYIHAPISGRIINKSVEQGQTVAASLSTPTIFTIAQDLSKMRILANVDESDIGQIKDGQKVKFTVQTYSDKEFYGYVTQIRLQATTVSNVVNYTVVIQADNEDKLLLPGMTATVDFYVNSRTDILLIPNGALRFTAPDNLKEEVRKNMGEGFKNIPDNIKAKMKKMGPPPGMNGVASKKLSKVGSAMAMVYYYDASGKIRMCPVETGLTDGKNTEIIRSRDLKAGIKVITGSDDASTTSSSSTKRTNTTNSLGGQNGPPPPMM
jgi:HlyD family secretion protein